MVCDGNMKIYRTSIEGNMKPCLKFHTTKNNKSFNQLFSEISCSRRINSQHIDRNAHCKIAQNYDILNKCSILYDWKNS